jgi:tetratricopeptide (TPR) repeat protein
MGRIQLNIIIFILCTILVCACSSSEKKDNQFQEASQAQYTEYSQVPQAQYAEYSQVPQAQYNNMASMADTTKSNSFQYEYKWLQEQADNIDVNYAMIAPRASAALKMATPYSQLEKTQFSEVALIAAVAYYIGNDPANGSDYASRAYTYRNDGSIVMLPQWKNKRWMELKGYAASKKLMKAKDAVLSLRNSGTEYYAKGNEAYLGIGQFADGLDAYQKALSQGLNSEKQRHLCYIRLAGCLFKANRLEEAEEYFLCAWLLNDNIKINFGDPATREFLNTLRGRYNTKK